MAAPGYGRWIEADRSMVRNGHVRFSTSRAAAQSAIGGGGPGEGPEPSRRAGWVHFHHARRARASTVAPGAESDLFRLTTAFRGI